MNYIGHRYFPLLHVRENGDTECLFSGNIESPKTKAQQEWPVVPYVSIN